MRCSGEFSTDHFVGGDGSAGLRDQMELIPSLSERYAAAGIYEVIRQLPTSNGEFGYRIKSAREPHERAVRESQLRRS